MGNVLGEEEGRAWRVVVPSVFFVTHLYFLMRTFLLRNAGNFFLGMEHVLIIEMTDVLYFNYILHCLLCCSILY